MTTFLLILGVFAAAMLSLFVGLAFRRRKDPTPTCHGLVEGETSHEDHTCDHCSCGASQRMRQP